MVFRRALKTACVLAGTGAVLALVVALVGFERTLAAVRRAGVAAFVASGVATAVFTLVQAAAWGVLSRPIRHRIRFRTLVAGMLVSQAGNTVTPCFYLGGEPLRVAYVGKVTGLPYHELAGTLVLAKYLEFLSVILVLGFSAVVAAVAYRHVLLRPPYAWGLSLLSVAALLVGLCVVLWISLVRRWRPLTGLVGAAAWLAGPRPWLVRVRGRATEMEDQASRVFCEEGGATRAGVGLLLLGHAAIFLKPWAFFVLAGYGSLGLGDLAMLFAAKQVLLSAQLTPGGVGVFDGGVIGTFALLGRATSEDAAMAMGFLLSIRLWDSVIVALGAFLGARVGASACSRQQAPGPDPPGDPAAASAGFFPYAFTPPAGIPRYARFRAEGRSPGAWVVHAFDYWRKQHAKLFSAPPEEVAYFSDQFQLLESLAAEPARPGDTPLAMVGDLLWLRNGWTTFLDRSVLDRLNAHAVVLGNLETVISPRFAVPHRLPESAILNSDPALVTSFRRPDGRNTFTALSFANNHALDYRDEGIRDTLAFLASEGIRCSGVRLDEADPSYVTFKANDIRFGFYAAAWGMNRRRRVAASKARFNILPGLAPEGAGRVDLSGVRAALAAMNANGVDFKIVALHWGFEFEMYPTPRVMQVGREIVRAGADVVMGSHPHVLQPAEVLFLNGYEHQCGQVVERLTAARHPTGCLIEDGSGRPRKAIVFYSLGNFATAMFSFLCRVGMIQGLRVRRHPDTGLPDWGLARGYLVYNVPPSRGTGGRRLVFLDDFLQSLGGNRPPNFAAHLDFLRRHVLAEAGGC